MWVFIMSINSIDEHSGYEFPWSPFNLTKYNVSAEFHEFHHFSNTGAFGSIFNFYDKLFKTDLEFNKFKKKK